MVAIFHKFFLHFHSFLLFLFASFALCPLINVYLVLCIA